MSTRKAPPAGYLLEELGWIDETEAAAAINVTPQTMAGYRKICIGPDFAEVARCILYSKVGLGKWLADGGTRMADEALKGKPGTFPVIPKSDPQAESKPSRRSLLERAR
jgi:hypothetical protein